MLHYLTDIDVSLYESASQIARLRTEAWVGKEIFCPKCGSQLNPAANNREACDFTCTCGEEFELKSKCGKIGSKIVNGAHDALTRRVTSNTNPNLYILQYRKIDLFVENFFAVPRYFFVPTIIERRKPLAITARRAGWVGCNILIGLVPDAGRIHYVRNGERVDKRSVLHAWNSVHFLEKQESSDARGWLLNIMKCIDQLNTSRFSLEDIYRFEPLLKSKYPQNNFIREKIRQQLQVLRDNGYLEFISRGQYCRVKY